MRVLQFPVFGFPDLWARSFQAARMAEGFRDCGVDSTLIYPWIGGALSWPDAAHAYGVQRPVARRLLAGSRLSATRPLRAIRPAALKASLVAVAAMAGRDDVLLGRHTHEDPIATFVALKARGLTRAKIAIELHEARHFMPAADPYLHGYVAINEALARHLVGAGIAESRIVVAPNAADLRPHEALASCDRRQLRRELALPEEQIVVCYTGQLFGGRNVEGLIAALPHLPDAYAAVIVGGHNETDRRRIDLLVQQLRLEERVRFVGQQPSAVITRYQHAADVLVIPYDLLHKKTALWCSPLKVPEYLASGTPIAAFPLPALREMLRDDDVAWANDGTPEALAAAIADASRRPRRGIDEVRSRLGNWTWSHRARRIADFLASPGR